MSNTENQVNKMSTSKTAKNNNISPLTQNEIADGWNLVLPKNNNKTTTHHFSVYLSQLPVHLWKHLELVEDKNGSEHYKTIQDKIYYYSVKMSKYDDQIKELYNQVMSDTPSITRITELYNELEQNRVKGWVMIKAKEMI